jgi:hypothetical protein
MIRGRVVHLVRTQQPEDRARGSIADAVARQRRPITLLDPAVSREGERLTKK